MLTGYDSIKNTNSVTASATVEFEWNMNDFGSPIIYGTSPAPINTDFSTVISAFGTLPSSGSIENRSASYTSTASGGKPSLYNDGLYYRIYNNVNDQPVSASFIINVDNLLTGTEKNVQENYGYVVSLWLKTPYNKDLLNTISETLNIDISCVALGSDPTIVMGQAGRKSLKATINSSDWTQVLIEFDNLTRGIRYLKLELKTNSQLTLKTELLVDQIQVFPITSHQAEKRNDYTQVNQIFKPYRPGEYLVKYKENSIINNNDQPSHFYPTDYGMNSNNLNNYISTSDDQYFSPKNLKTFVPYITRTVEQFSDGNNIVWSLYDNNFNANKIVIKNNLASLKLNNATSTLNVSVLQKSAGVYTWTVVGTVTPNANGISILYYNSSLGTWSTTKWSSAPNILSGSISNYTQICGVSVECVVSSPNQTKTTAMFVEVSPRLIVDVSTFIESYSINKEMSDDSDPLPIGQATSDVLTLNLNNFPIINGANDAPLYATQTDVIPFNNNSKNSPLYGVLRKGIGCFLKLTVNNTTIPQFSGYVNSVKASEDSTEFEIFDIIKTIQDVTLPASRSIFSKMGVEDAIQQTLRAAGIHDFDKTMPGLNVIPNFQQKINFYWVEKDENALSAIDELAKIYQVALYSDEYGKIQITIPPTLNTSGSINFYLNDIATATELSNIISFQENNAGIPKNLSISYDVPAISKAAKGITVTSKEGNGSQMFNYSQSPIWQPSEPICLSNFELGQNFLKGDTRIVLSQTTSILNRSTGYSGYYLIDQEIISFNAREYDFFYTVDSNPVASSTFIAYPSNPVKVYSQENLDKIVSTIKNSISGVTSVSNKEKFALAEVQRGLFGTEEADHYLESSSWTYYNPAYLYSFNPDTATNNAIFSSPTGKDFGILKVNTTASISIKNGYMTIPANNAFVIPYNYHVPWTGDKSAVKHNYFRALVQLGRPGVSGSFTPTANGNYCGIFIQGDTKRANGLWVGVGSKATGVNSQSIIVKAFGAGGVMRHMEFTENTPSSSLNKSAGFGTSLIDLNNPILFEVYLNRSATSNTYYAKILINGFLITNLSGQALFKEVLDKNISITSSNYLLIPCNFSDAVSSNFGIFNWYSGAQTNGNVGAIVSEIVFGNSGNVLSYNYNDTNGSNLDFEKQVANDILSGIDYDKESIKSITSLSKNNFFRWTGSKNAQEIKIFDINIDQKPIFNSNIDIYARPYQIKLSSYLNNYIV